MTARPRKGQAVRFTAADGARQPVDADPVAGLRFTIQARSGGAVAIDLVDLRPRRLAIAFAAALRGATGIGGSLGAADGIKRHVWAYRAFFGHLHEHDPAVDGPEELRATHIDVFEQALETRGLRPMNRHLVLAKIIIALRGIDAAHPTLLDAGLRRRIAYTSSQSPGSSHPRDAYSPFVARQLRDAARADVEQLLRRLQDRTVLGCDAVLERGIATVDAVVAEQGRVGCGHPAFRNLYFMHRRRGLATSHLIDDVHGRRYLLAGDLPPLIALLSLETGLELECCTALTVDCLCNPSAGTVAIGYVKRRARGAEHKQLRVRDGGVGTPGGLIRRLIEITAPARAHHPSDRLWVHFRAGRLTDWIGYPRFTLNSWTTRHRIVDDQGRPLHLVLARLRKTHKALWYMKTEGHMARFAVGHTPDVAARHYADLPSLRGIHEAAVADALTEAVAAAAPVVLTPEQEMTGPDDFLATHNSVLQDGDQDVWLASCSGFYASPFGAAGSPCSHPFWGCLECGNAVITARKLPAILGFLAFIETERAGMTADDWRLKFGRAYTRITAQIVPAFSDAVIVQARATLAAEGTDFYAPPEARA